MILQLVTDRRRLSAASASHAEAIACLRAQAQFAIDAGVDMIQVRERDLSSRDLHDLVSSIVALAAGTSTRILVNDRMDVAIACGAHGVHLRGDSVPAQLIRRLAPSGFLIGRSVHGVDEALSVAADVDYLVAGAVWGTESKPAGYPTLGPDRLAQIAAAAQVPVLAIGGVSMDRLSSVASAGAAGAAAIGLFMGPPGRAESGACRATALRDVVRDARRRFDTSGPPS